MAKGDIPRIKLFISHSSADLALAAKLVDLIRAALLLPGGQVRCTSLEGYRLPGGAATELQLREEIRSADAFVGIVSAESIQSLFVLFELGARWGIKRTFVLMHVVAFLLTPVVCWVPWNLRSYGLLLVLLPVFAFFAQGIHAGYAVYFPTLFPTHLRATGSGFCFNTGRILASPVLIWLSAWMKSAFSLRTAMTCLGVFFLLGLVMLRFLPETKGKDLPE